MKYITFINSKITCSDRVQRGAMNNSYKSAQMSQVRKLGNHSVRKGDEGATWWRARGGFSG